jgi:hypothetical protein
MGRWERGRQGDKGTRRWGDWEMRRKNFILNFIVLLIIANC